MEVTKTERGFSIIKFTDTNGEHCSLQESSSAMEGKIWLGVDNTKLTVFQDEQKGKYIQTEMPDNFSVNTRMHLNRQQAADLLPHLIKFIETGVL